MAGAYFAYMYTRKLVYMDFEGTALDNAARIVTLEKSLGFFWEPHWQSWALNSAKAIVIFFNWAYIITFLPIVITTAVILYIRDRRRYQYYRKCCALQLCGGLDYLHGLPPVTPSHAG